MKQNYTAKLTEDVYFEKYLNESFQRLYEYYHKLTDFVEFINQTTNHIIMSQLPETIQKKINLSMLNALK